MIMKSIHKWISISILSLAVLFTGCDDDDSPTGGMDELESATFSYAFNEGQLLDNVETAYRGDHNRELTAEFMIEEQENGTASVTVTLRNTIQGENYPVHVHDAADPATTPNGTPYNETPNGDIFAQAVTGTGGEVSATNQTSMMYDELLNNYEGFFVVHDPTQEISTVDLTTYLILGSFAQNLAAGESSLRTESYTYAFNEGQLLGNDDVAYGGDHPRNLAATLMIEERGNGNATVSVMLENTLDGLDYAVHSHDAADPATTPNGTPYNETPNADVFAGVLTGNGGSVSMENETEIPFTELTEEYEAFFVVHDPTQEISTVDLTTYLVLGTFAESLEAGEPKLAVQTFEYDFNEGQLLDSDETAYNGEHARNLSATMQVEELIDGRAKITVTLENTLDGETYPVHSHDAADPDTTENGTPYNETPNADIFAQGIEGTGGTASAENETEEILYRDLVNTYEGFFVVHDPTQEISTVDLTTYLVLGLTAR
jgi:phage terminase large subunit-like protein